MGIVVLEHRDLRSRVAICRDTDSHWTQFADIRACDPRQPWERDSHFLQRLEHDIDASPSKGRGAPAFLGHVNELEFAPKREQQVTIQKTTSPPAIGKDPVQPALPQQRVEALPTPIREFRREFLARLTQDLGPSSFRTRSPQGKSQEPEPRPATDDRPVKDVATQKSSPTIEATHSKQPDPEPPRPAVATRASPSGRTTVTTDALNPVDLPDIAQKLDGYSLRPRDSGWGISVLENAELNDRVAMARKPDGQWIFAAVPNYAFRADHEPPDEAFARLHRSIHASPFKGEGTHEFTQHVEQARQHAEQLRRDRPIDLAAAQATDALLARSHETRPLSHTLRSGSYFAEYARTPPRDPVAREIWSHELPPTLRRDFSNQLEAIDAISLRAIAQRAGYILSPNDTGKGIEVWENPARRDRIAIASSHKGHWIYADVRSYEPRQPDEPPDRALGRLRDAISGSPSVGQGYLAFEERLKGLAVQLAREDDPH
ncbi:MAG: hypothetical protein FWD17_03945, partial [Polyangiaceae bacterium]|nr:hypothetical protein [Polyangiaceae bacterium]